MMRGSLVVLAGVFFLSGCGSKELKEFKSPAGGFKVLMPGNPKEQTQNTAAGQFKMYSVEERNGAYMAGFADTPIPPNEPEAKTQIRLDGARDGAVGNIKGTLVREAKIQLSGNPGREIEANLPQNKGIVRARFYIVGSRMYQIMVVGTKSFAGSSDATKFLDSFALSN